MSGPGGASNEKIGGGGVAKKSTKKKSGSSSEYLVFSKNYLQTTSMILFTFLIQFQLGLLRMKRLEQCGPKRPKLKDLWMKSKLKKRYCLIAVCDSQVILKVVLSTLLLGDRLQTIATK